MMSSRSPQPKIAWLLVVCCCAVQAAAAPVLNTARVRLPADCNLGEALAALHHVSGYPIVSELPQLPLRARGEARAVEETAALQVVSSAFHLHAVRRPRSLALQLRYVSPAEAPDVELEELTAAAADISRMAAALAPPFDGIRETRDQDSFFDSLTPEQTEAMRAGGVPLRALTREQQALWRRINLTNGLGQEELTAGRVHTLLAGWSRDELVYLTQPTYGNKEPVTALWLRYPNPLDPSGAARASAPLPPPLPPTASVPEKAPGDGTAAAQPVVYTAAGTSGEDLPARVSPAAALRTPLAGEDGETTLGALVDRIAAMTERRIEIPAYARERRLLAYVSGARAADVLTALEDLYGWTFRSESRHYVLARPRALVPRSPADLEFALHLALPPAMRRALNEEADATRVERKDLQWREIHTAIRARKGPDWRQVWLTELDAVTQRRVANRYFEGHMRESRAARPSLPPTLVAPERGYFRVKGTGPNPMLLFHVPRADGQVDLWGWAANTSSARSGK